MCRRKGFDGVEADNVDGYTQDSGFPLTADDQLRFNRWSPTLAHERSMTIGLKNDLDQVAALVGDFDFAVNESCVEYRECEALTPFTAQGKPVLHVEYDLDTNAFCPVTERLGFRSIRKPLDLNAPVEPCPAVTPPDTPPGQGAPDAVAQVHDALRGLHLLARGQPPDQVEVDAGQVVEQPPSLPEQHRDDVQLQLVELPGPQERLRRPGPLHHDVGVPGGGAGQRGGLAGVGDVADAARRRLGRDLVGEDEDRDAVVVVAVPLARVLVRAAPGDHGAGGHRLGDTWPLGPGSSRRSSQLNRRNPPSPMGASTLSCGPTT